MITIWGAVEGINSLYTVSIDGSEPKSYGPPSNTSPEPIVALAHASNLGPGRHTVTVKSLPKDGKSRIEIASAENFTNLKLTLPVKSNDGSFTFDASSSGQNAL
ncbi:hypothetical protein M407DRAFT_29936 [Tulasnella calospora MUT 4182]|uniref:Uncharacterized protein n=1 Tax=Tulasnella calospora MUT 4182 TaxID=1051891 RepID=A0A0C3KG04_9AGAM|nr:hypothetical protein M407DRAFT_29936 [Tulasnella calospora MUT 4182]